MAEIPEDLRDTYKLAQANADGYCWSGSQRNGNGIVKLIERIATLTAERDALKAERGAFVHDLSTLQNLNNQLQAENSKLKAQLAAALDANKGLCEEVSRMGSELAALDLECKRLSAPVSDDEVIDDDAVPTLPVERTK